MEYKPIKLYDMKNFIILLISFLVLSCGSNSKEYMQTVLSNELHRSYNDANIVSMVNAELKDVEEKENMFGGTYYGTFNCTLRPLENKDVIRLWGEVAFDSNKLIKTMPERYGKNKIAIYISLIAINGTPVDSKDINRSKYVLDVFMNRNKVSGND